mmetsp:Transcript_41956/g.87527  ORF Transcript_41956/g.87527 Transcript_41956/m.87527 type:complete len:157 (+) Transcript_41956:2-472(+)
MKAHPKTTELVPPGAWCNRVVGLSVMQFPAFWLPPFAKQFADTFAGTEAPPSPPKTTELVPPGAWCNLVLDLSVMTFPEFWLAPLAKQFEDTDGPATLLVPAPSTSELVSPVACWTLADLFSLWPTPVRLMGTFSGVVLLTSPPKVTELPADLLEP